MTGLVWRGADVVADRVNLKDLPALRADHGVVVWLDLCGPGREVLPMLADQLGLDPHSVEDSVAHADRPKATRRSGHTFITAYGTSFDEGTDREVQESRLRLSRISAFVLPRLLITVRPDEAFPMDVVVAHWADNADLLDDAAHAIGALLHGLLDVVVDQHFRTIEELDDAIEDIEGMLFDEHVTTRDVQHRVYRMRKELVQLRRVVLPMREIVNTVLRHRREVWLGERDPLGGYYDDLYDHVLRAAEWTESLRDMVTTVFETNLSLQDAHLNTVMKKLAGWAAIIAVPTAVTGWYGQNIPYPGFGEAFGLAQSAVLVLFISVILYVVFRRKDWL